MSGIVAPSITEPAVIPAANEPVAGTPSVGNFNNRKVEEITERDVKQHSVPNSKLLKVLAVILIVISIATILAGLTIGIGLIAKGTALMQYMPYMVVGLTIMGPTGAKIAAIAFAVFGGLGTWGGFALWKHSDNLHTTETITKSRVIEGQTITITQPPQVIQLPPLPPQIVHVAVPTPVPPSIVPTPVATVPAEPKPKTTPAVPQQPGANKIQKSVFNFADQQISKIPEYVYNAAPNDPNSIKQIENIKTLNLANNTISELPDGIFTLKNLTKLDLSNNKFVSLKNIEKLTNLEELDLRGNPDLNNLEHIATLANLRTIELDPGKDSLIPKNLQYKVTK